jgi:Spy/CpxP family protein refolding chaperone
MRSSWLTGILVLSLAVNAAILGTLGYHYFINPPRSGPAPCFTAGDGHLYQSLGLTGEQLSKMEPLAHAFHRHMDAMKAAMEQKRDRLIDLLHRGDDTGKIEALRAEMASIQDAIQKEVIAHISDIKKILDSKQQERFFHLMRESMNCTGTSPFPSSGGSR